MILIPFPVGKARGKQATDSDSRRRARGNSLMTKGSPFVVEPNSSAKFGGVTRRRVPGGRVSSRERSRTRRGRPRHDQTRPGSKGQSAPNGRGGEPLEAQPWNSYPPYTYL